MFQLKHSQNRQDASFLKPVLENYLKAFLHREKADVKFCLVYDFSVAKGKFSSLIKDGITEKNQRRLMVTYCNDEDLDYKTAIMYMTDTTYSIHTINEANKDIEYNSFTIELIEY